MSEYKIFLKKGESLEEDREIDVDVIDQDTFQRHRVRAIVSRNLDDPSYSDRVWLQYEDAIMPISDQPWAIKIIHKMEEEAEKVEIAPKKRISLGERRGDMLRTMILERKKN